MLITLICDYFVWVFLLRPEIGLGSARPSFFAADIWRLVVAFQLCTYCVELFVGQDRCITLREGDDRQLLFDLLGGVHEGEVINRITELRKEGTLTLSERQTYDGFHDLLFSRCRLW